MVRLILPLDFVSTEGISIADQQWARKFNMEKIKHLKMQAEICFYAYDYLQPD